MQSTVWLNSVPSLWSSRRRQPHISIKVLTHVFATTDSCKFDHPGAGGPQQSNRFGALGGGGNNNNNAGNLRGLGEYYNLTCEETSPTK